MIVLPFVSSGIGVWQSYLSNVVGQRVMDALRLALDTHLQWMPLRFFTETRTGEIQSRIGNDVNGVQSVVTDTAAALLSNFATVATTVVAMLILDWRLTILSLGMLPIFAYITYRVGKVRREVSTLTQRSLAEVEEVVLQEVERLVRDGITEAELAKVRAQLRARFVYDSDSVTDIAHQLGYFETIGSSWQQYQELIPRLAHVSLDQVNAAVRKYLTVDNRTVGWFEPQAR